MMSNRLTVELKDSRYGSSVSLFDNNTFKRVFDICYFGCGSSRLGSRIKTAFSACQDSSNPRSIRKGDFFGRDGDSFGYITG